MNISWPQGIVAVLLILGIARGMLKHGEPNGHVNFFASAISAAITFSLLWWGGFWK